jgi:hypothetical protein
VYIANPIWPRRDFISNRTNSDYSADPSRIFPKHRVEIHTIANIAKNIPGIVIYESMV